MAKQIYVSKRTIGSLFRKRLGVTFIQFLTQCRLVEAQTLIIRGESLKMWLKNQAFVIIQPFTALSDRNLAFLPDALNKCRILQSRKCRYGSKFR